MFTRTGANSIVSARLSPSRAPIKAARRLRLPPELAGKFCDDSSLISGVPRIVSRAGRCQIVVSMLVNCTIALNKVRKRI